ncbi:MAG: hypothetical protein ABIM50_01145 [Novosphingobium sp.]
MTTTTDCPTFVDLRVLVQSAPAVAGQDDPFGAGAHRLPARAGPCTLLVVSLADGSGTSAGLDADTWVIVESGAVTLTGPAGDIDLREGQSAVIARGTPFAWRSYMPTLLIGMAYPVGDAGEPGIIAIDNSASLAPSRPAEPARSDRR